MKYFTHIAPLIQEFIGTFALVYFGGFTVFSSSGKMGVAIPALGHGAILFAMIFAGAQTSGAHYNPAVTIALVLTRNAKINISIFYIVAQLLGSTAAGYAIKMLRPTKYDGFRLGYPRLSPDLEIYKAFAVEFSGTALLMFSIYACAVHRKAEPEVCCTIIALTLVFLIISFGPLTGASFNPARIFGPCLVDKELTMEGWWVYYVASILGACFSALVYKFVLIENEVDKKTENEAAKGEKAK